LRYHHTWTTDDITDREQHILLTLLTNVHIGGTIANNQFDTNSGNSGAAYFADPETTWTNGSQMMFYRLSANNNANGWAVITGRQWNEQIAPKAGGRFIARFRVSGNDTNYICRIGLSSVRDDSTPAACILLEGSKADSANWRTWCRSGGTGTANNSSTAVVFNEEVTLRIEWESSSSVKFYINDTLIATETSNVPLGTILYLYALGKCTTATYYSTDVVGMEVIQAA
jgi:hypothetical protein